MLAFISCCASAKTYYVNSRYGNDNNSGTSESKAWKTLNKVTQEVFYPGDKILLKRNEIFKGCLILHGSGTTDNSIELSAYGVGKMPVIYAGKNEYAIKIMNEQGWKIENIETSGGEKAGIFIGCTKDSVNLSHFRIIDCYVHNVGNDSVYTYDYSTVTGGIVVANGMMVKDKEYLFNHATFNDVVMDGCTVKYIKRWTCFSISCGYANKGDSNYIRNCTAAYSVSDGIRMNGVRNSYIDNCVMYKCGAWPKKHNWGGLGAWFFGADNCTIQFCEASHIESPRQDGGAFDIDYWQTNSTVQYCYGHDCHGYGVSVFGADPTTPTVNSLVRYNIFSNNARDTGYAYQGDIYVFTWNKGLLNGVKIYNNTSYWNPSAKAPAFNDDADFTGNNPNLFENNIIYSDSSWLVYRKNNGLKCDYNLYWTTNGKPLWEQGKKKYHSLAGWQNATGQDKHSLYKYPLLNNPSYHGEKSPAIQFIPKKNSPAIHAGTDVGDMGSRDFLGNKISINGKYDIGACENSQVKPIIRVGAVAPSFNAYTINGKEINLNDFRGSNVLLSFIDMQHFNKLDSSQETRAQLAFIKSIYWQYPKDHLKIILVDASVLKTGKITSKKKLINFIWDNQLNKISILSGKIGEKIAEKYSIHILPTIFLVDPDGHISQIWENVALSSQLMLALHEPAMEKVQGHTDKKIVHWDTHAEAIFPGFVAARPLSDKIWLVDGGSCWKRNYYPVRLLVLNDQASRIKLIMINKTRDKIILNTVLRQLPKDECKTLLNNMPEMHAGISSVMLPASLKNSGKYILKAEVFNNKNKLFLTGEAHITVD